MTPPPQRASSIAALTGAATLSSILHLDIGEVRIEPLSSVGFSNAALTRVRVITGDGGERVFVLKRTRPDADWTAWRTNDPRGREALFLGEPALAPVWDVFDCPYVAFAVEPGEIGLLLSDLTHELLPDVRAPLSEAEESALLGALASLHARFWNRVPSALEWLVRPAHYCDMLAASVAGDAQALGVLSAQLRDSVPRGWASAFTRLPAVAARRMTCPGSEWERRWAELPRTLLHGDAKVANFALRNGRVAAFDWAVAGNGPCAIDLGWYVAVNASRLTAAKETIMMRYRNELEAALNEPLPDSLWTDLESAAVICGARMLLWSKALALDAERPGAAEEWSWWVDRLAAIPQER